jgi:hypothetical protein
MVPNTRDYYPGFLQAFTGVTTNLITREAHSVLALPRPRQWLLRCRSGRSPQRCADRDVSAESMLSACRSTRHRRCPSYVNPRRSKTRWECRRWRYWAVSIQNARAPKLSGKR